MKKYMTLFVLLCMLAAEGLGGCFAETAEPEATAFPETCYLLETVCGDPVACTLPREICVPVKFDSGREPYGVYHALSSDEQSVTVLCDGSFVPEPDGTLNLRLLLRFPGTAEIRFLNAEGEEAGRFLIQSETADDHTGEVCPHSFVPEIVAPTETSRGYTIHTCELCCRAFRDTYTDALPHLCRQESRTVPPTCSQQGYTEHRCVYCEETVRDCVTQCLGHSYSITVTPPACETEGYTTETCSVCGECRSYDFVPAAGHRYTVRTVEATYRSEGYTLHRCQFCGDEYRDSFTPLKECPHAYTVSTQDPSCDREGFTRHTCRLCGYSYTDNAVPAAGHRISDRIIAPTASSGGYTLHSCSVCGMSWQDSWTEMLPSASSGSLSCEDAMGYGNGYLNDRGLEVSGDRTADNSGFEWSVSYPGSITQEELNRHVGEAVDTTVDALKHYAVDLDGMTEEEAEAGIGSMNYRTEVTYNEQTGEYVIVVLYG